MPPARSSSTAPRRPPDGAPRGCGGTSWRTGHQGSTQLRFLPVRARSAGPTAVPPRSAAAIRRVDDVVDLVGRGHVQGLAVLVRRLDHRGEEGLALGRVLDGVEFAPEPEPYGAFEPHPPELAARPCHHEQRRPEATAGHGLGPEPVALAQHDGAQRHGETGPDHEHAADMADLTGALGLRADHESRGVAEGDDGHVVGVAQLQEPGGLVGPVGIDGPAEMGRVVGQDADRTPLDTGQGRDHPGSESAPEFEHRATVGQKVDDGPDVVRPQPLLGHDRAEQPLVGALPRRGRTLEVGEVPPSQVHGLGVVGRHQVDHAVGRLDVEGPDLLGGVGAESTSLDHGRAAHPDRGALRGDDDVAAAEQRGVAGEAPARGDADQRDEAAQAGEEGEGLGVEPRDHRVVGVPRPTPAAFGEQHHG